MRYLLLSLALFIFTTNVFPQTAKVDTILTEKWNGTAWENYIKTINTYDANCQLTSTISEQWNGTFQTWDNAYLFSYTYISGDHINEVLTQLWNSSTTSWGDLLKQKYSYDGSFKILTLTTDFWDGSTWNLASKTSYSYDINGYYDSLLTKIVLSGPLQNSSLDIYNNNVNGTPHQILNQSWNIFTHLWDTSSRRTYNYNSSAKPLTSFSEVWQTNTWINSQLSSYTYSGSGILTNTLSQIWNGSVWVDDLRNTYYYTTSCTLLPLHLISFTASKNKNIVTLNWQTAEEINTSHFNIQRSTDGTNFSNVGKINAAGSGNHNYSFADNIQSITGDKVYYRLQMTDKDGKFSYSKILPLTLQLFTGNIKTYPNPVKDQLYILFNMQNATKAELRITDAAGRIVHVQRLATAQTNNAVSVNVAALPKGAYYVQVITDKGIQKTQFVKQ